MKHIISVKVVLRNNGIFVNYAVDEGGDTIEVKDIGAFPLTEEAKSLILFAEEKVRDAEGLT